MDRDLIMGLVVGAVLLASLIGVLFFEAATTPGPELAYPVQWAVMDGATTQRDDQLEEGENRTYRFDLATANVTTITVALLWEDDVGQPDRFNLTVRPPSGDPVKGSADNGTLRLAFPLDEVPSVANVTGRDRQEAVAKVLEHGGDQGMGTWQVTVTLAQAPGQRPVPQAQQLETQPDGANTYTVSFTYDHYRAQIGPPQAQP